MIAFISPSVPNHVFEHFCQKEFIIKKTSKPEQVFRKLYHCLYQKYCILSTVFRIPYFDYRADYRFSNDNRLLMLTPGFILRIQLP